MAKEEARELRTEEESVRRRVRSGSTAPDRVELGRIGEVDTEPERSLIAQSYEARAAQAGLEADRRTAEAEQALRRAEEEAQPQFQAERDRIAAEEQRALDNQALYAELRGDRGGIGQAQTASIRNTAALNRAQVEREQRGLAAETAQKIADLRRQGEYEKADSLLKLTQQQLSELLELERWAKETNLSVAQFNTQLARWEAEYAWQAQKFGVETELSTAKLTGAFSDGTPTFEARQAERTRLAEAARQLLAAGLTLTPEQLAALGWSEGQYEDYILMRSGGGEAAGTGENREKTRGRTHVLKKGKELLEERVGALTEGKAGSGAPFQLVASWITELKEGDNPYAAYREMEDSPYFEQMNARQRSWIAEAFQTAVNGQ